MFQKELRKEYGDFGKNYIIIIWIPDFFLQISTVGIIIILSINRQRLANVALV